MSLESPVAWALRPSPRSRTARSLSHATISDGVLKKKQPSSELALDCIAVLAELAAKDAVGTLYVVEQCLQKRRFISNFY